MIMSRLERAFGLLKEELHVNNRDEITIEGCIIQTVKWAENKLVEQHTLAQRKDMQFYDEDPEILKELNAASIELNKIGCLAFKKSIDMLKNKSTRLQVDDNGVKEVFREGDDEDDQVDKIYSTSLDRCDCTRWMQDRCP